MHYLGIRIQILQVHRRDVINIQKCNIYGVAWRFRIARYVCLLWRFYILDLMIIF